MKTVNLITDLIGNTPILRHKEYPNIFMKIEYFNPLGSVKDRIALAIVEGLEKSGAISVGGTIIEATSGNTGIGLAYVCAAKGYKLILTMPESMSDERKNLLRALGANLILTPAARGMKGAVEESEKLQKMTPNSCLALQFENPVNPQCHYETTAREIYSDLEGKIDVFIAGVGTGGTFSGCSKYFKEQNSSIYTVAVEPLDSPLLSQGIAGSHKIQGIGANFIPKNFNRKYCDEVFDAPFDASKKIVRELAIKQGLFVGISSGASVYVATQLAQRRQFEKKNIIVILPDTGERYISTSIFEKE